MVRRPLSLVGALALATLVVVPAAGPAHATSTTWSPPLYLSGGASGDAAYGPSLSMLADGSLVATWSEQDAGSSSWLPMVATEPFSGGWSDATALSSTPMTAPMIPKGGVRSAVDGSGHLVAAWLSPSAGSPGDNDVVGATATLTPGQVPDVAARTFAQRATDHHNTYLFNFTPQVAMSLDGTGTVELTTSSTISSLGPWAGTDGIAGGAAANHTDPQQEKATTNIADGSNSDYGHYVPSLGVAARTADWRSSVTDAETLVTTSPNYVTQQDGHDVPGDSALLYETSDPDAWASGDPAVVPMEGTDAAAAPLAGGRAIVANDTEDGVHVWETGQSVATVVEPDTGGPAGTPQIATFHDGSATIAYLDDDTPDGSTLVKAVHVTAAGVVGTPETLSASGSRVNDVSVAYAPDGTSYVVWAGGPLNGSSSQVSGLYVSQAGAGDTFPTTPDVVDEGLGLNATDPRIAVDQTGSPTVVASVEDPAGALRVAAFTPQAPPTATAAPVVTPDKPRVGDELTCKGAVWANRPTALSFAWYRGTTLVGRGTGYTATVADLGHALSCLETASNDTGTSSSRSKETAAVAKGVITPPPHPTITGTPKVGKRLVAHPGPHAAAVHLAYAWLRNGKPVAHETSTGFRLTKADAGRRIAVRVTATRTGYETVARTSAAKKVMKVKKAKKPRRH